MTTPAQGASDDRLAAAMVASAVRLADMYIEKCDGDPQRAALALTNWAVNNLDHEELASAYGVVLVRLALQERLPPSPT